MFKYVMLLVCLSYGGIFAQDIYVDPSASGTGDGTSWENAYTSLAAAESNERKDLVTAQTSITFYCRGGEDVAPVHFAASNWTANATYFITIEVPLEYRHMGLRYNGYRINVPRQDYTIAFFMEIPYSVVNGLAFDSKRDHRDAIRVTARYVTVKNCFVYDIEGNSSTGINFKMGSEYSKMINCVVMNCSGTAITTAYGTGVVIYNCTSVNNGCAIGVGGDAARQVTIKNCYFGGSYGYIDDGLNVYDEDIELSSAGAAAITSTYTTDGGHGTTIAAYSDNSGANFVSVTDSSEDVHIKAGSALIGVGVDFSSDPVFPFNYDADGQVRSDGNWSAGAYDFSGVIPADTTPPVISDINSSVTETTATITWTTDELTTSAIDYGLTTGYGTMDTSGALVTVHSIILSGLTPKTQYHFQITSADDSGNVARSSDYTFTTDSLVITHIAVRPAVAPAVGRTNRQFPVYDINGRAADIKQTGIYLIFDEKTNTLKKTFIIQK